jgi:hypothetical protein
LNLGRHVASTSVGGSFQVLVLASDSGNTGIAALVGVALGGIITISGQLLIERRHRKTAAGERRRAVKGAARLAWNELWHAQGTLRHALQTTSWWELSHQLHSPLTDHDRRLLAEELEWRQWSDVTRVWRRLSRLRADREVVAAASPDNTRLSIDEQGLIADAIDACECASAALAVLAGSPIGAPFDQMTRDPRLVVHHGDHAIMKPDQDPSV